MVKGLPVTLVDSGHHMQAVLSRCFLPTAAGRSVWNLLRKCEGFFARVEHVAGVTKLRQHEQMRTIDCGILDELKAPLNVPRLLPYDRLHLDAGNFDRVFLARPPIVHLCLPKFAERL